MGFRSNGFACRASAASATSASDRAVCSRDTIRSQDELDWLDSEGPVSPDLLARLQRSAGEFDFVLLFSVRYHQAYYGARAVPDRAVLVPTAEREPALGLAIFQPIFRGVRAIMYNSFEERAAIQAPGAQRARPWRRRRRRLDDSSGHDPQRARQTFGLSRPVRGLCRTNRREQGMRRAVRLLPAVPRASSRRDLDLVLIGTPAMPIPAHPRIRHLGFVSDQDKFDVLAAADALVMPSYFESLSMVALEAWALGRPVLANARCDVLLGQCIRSNAGLYYENAGEFAAALDRLLDDAGLADGAGRATVAQYFAQHYSWPVIERKYLDMFDRLASAPAGTLMEPLPGWFARRRPTVPAALDVLASCLPDRPASTGPPQEVPA